MSSTQSTQGSSQSSQMPPPASYTIGGVRVHFPTKAYPSQIAMMSKVIQGLKNKQNCLLESPTGSGKSLALLCASLAWQRHEAERVAKHNAEIDAREHQRVTEVPKPSLKQCQDNWGNGNAAKEETEKEAWVKPTVPVSISDAEFTDDDDDFQPPKRVKQSKSPENGQSSWNKEVTDIDSFQTCCSTKTEDAMTGGNSSAFVPPDRKLQVPKIFFGTRTHKQIAQIMRELRKTEYCRVRAVILGSRDYTCVNPAVANHPNKNESCKELLDSQNREGGGCLWHMNSKKFGTYVNLANVGIRFGFDLEEFVHTAKVHRACPYYATKNLMLTADIVFCPYNYLVEPHIRKSMSVELEGQVVIFDEAHNMEDSSRDAASTSIIQDDIHSAFQDCEKVGRAWSGLHAVRHEELAQFLSELAGWMDSESKTMAALDYNNEEKHWIGTEFVAFMTNIGLVGNLETCKTHFKGIMEQREMQLELMKDRERVKVVGIRDKPVISSATVKVFEEVFRVFHYLQQDDGKYRDDFRVALLKATIRRRRDDTASLGMNRNVLSLNFWCLNPALAFRELRDQVHCIILTSGTLSPIHSFQSELGTPFPIKLEASHVIDPNQVFAGVVACGPNNRGLNGSYQSVETFEYQDELGMLIARVCRLIPHGVLCFFPSYRLMEKVISRWKMTRCLEMMENIKDMYIEPRAGNAEFQETMNSFYASIDETNDGPRGNTTGALFMAVCRGKVSEGLDFADNNARAVICIGIPFPNYRDLQVGLKRDYNDKNRARGLLSGGEWYEIQAFRALNQALGRCIRHRHDWGAILLVDDRYQKTPRYINSLSKWVRNSVQQFNDWTETEDVLVQFRDQMLSAMPRPVKTSREIDIDLPENGSQAGTGVFLGNNESSSSSSPSGAPGHSDHFSSSRGIPVVTPNRQLAVNVNSSKSPFFSTTNTPPSLFSIFAKPRRNNQKKSENRNGSKISPITFDDED